MQAFLSQRRTHFIIRSLIWTESVRDWQIYIMCSEENKMSFTYWALASATRLCGSFLLSARVFFADFCKQSLEKKSGIEMTWNPSERNEMEICWKHKVWCDISLLTLGVCLTGLNTKLTQKAWWLGGQHCCLIPPGLGLQILTPTFVHVLCRYSFFKRLSFPPQSKDMPWFVFPHFQNCMNRCVCVCTCVLQCLGTPSRVSPALCPELLGVVPSDGKI